MKHQHHMEIHWYCGEFLDMCLMCEQNDGPETQKSSCGLRDTSEATAQIFHGWKNHHGSPNTTM